MVRKVAEPASKSRRSSAKQEEATVRKTRAAAEEPAPAKRSRAKAVAEEAPARKTRAKRADPEDQEEVPVKKTRAKASAESEAPVGFNPYSGLDDTLDNIEKHVGLSESSMESGGRLSTGNLMLDIILGGGITAGWYTNFGQEQSCKTTGAVTIMSAAINADVPILYYWDYEGCLSFDAQVTVNGVKQGLGELFTGMNLVPYMAVDTSDLNILVDTVNGPTKVTAAMYKGPKPITKVVLENGLLLRGYKHPVLVCSVDGLLEWKYLEELAIGDNLVVQDTSASHVG